MFVLSRFSSPDWALSTRTNADPSFDFFPPLFPSFDLAINRFAGVNIKKVTPSDQNATGAFDAAVTTLAGSDANVASMWNQSMAYVGNNSIAWVSLRPFLSVR